MTYYRPVSIQETVKVSSTLAWLNLRLDPNTDIGS